MRHLSWIALLVLSLTAHANDMLRVGQQVLTTGDPAARAIDLMGTPFFKEPVENKFGAYVGESWQFKQKTGRIVTFTMAGGKVVNIEESHQY